MKTLAALSFLQIVAIVFLAIQVMKLDPAGTESAASEPAERISNSDQAVLMSPEREGPRQLADERQLRRIVREELAAQLDLLAMPDPDAAEYLDPLVEAEQEFQRERVEQEIAHHISVGKISDVDMQNLQAAIASLDKDGQKEMLSLLVRALNTGELEGRL
jgi:hypothetical protein